MMKILIKGKGITEDPSSRDRLASWENNGGQFAVLNPNNPYEQEKLKKDPSGGQITSMCNRDVISWTKS